LKKIIIGIHGLGNQPPKDLLEKWWKDSIEEGLEKIGCKNQKYNFELVYWANAIYKKPLDINEENKDSEYYLAEKYHPASDNKPKNERKLKTKARNYIKKQLDNFLFNEKLHINFPSFTDLLIKHFFKDMKLYFTQNCVEANKTDCLAKDVIRLKLLDKLQKHKNDEVLLICHSMGSIVAYDVLLRHENEINIDTLISEGSPIAVPYIFGQIKYALGHEPYNDSKLTTPNNIKKAWYNLFDQNDKLAQYSILNELFEPNIYNIVPNSEMVKNDYENDGLENPHKIYGYLRTEKNAHLLDEFLCRGKNKVVLWITKKIRKIFN